MPGTLVAHECRTCGKPVLRDPDRMTADEAWAIHAKTCNPKKE